MPSLVSSCCRSVVVKALCEVLVMHRLARQRARPSIRRTWPAAGSKTAVAGLVVQDPDDQVAARAGGVDQRG